MTPKYGYSFYGDGFVGSFDQPEQALAAAVAEARRQADPPVSVYIGRLVPSDPQARKHASAVVASMTARAKAQDGDRSAQYLRNVSIEQLKDLDGALEQAILGWLDRSGLRPTSTRVEAISERPIPQLPRDPNTTPAPRRDEVSMGDVPPELP